MYRYSVHFVKDAGELTPPTPAYQLHSVEYAAPDRLICVWVNDPESFDVGWGETTWAVAETNIPQGACG